MLTCFQFKGITVLQHGQSVAEWYADFVGCRQFNWRMPAWANDRRIKANLLPTEIMRLYHWYHDSGKPFCRVIDADGRQHFPEHAVYSYHRWLECSDGSEDALIVAELISKDMLAHLAKGEKIDQFCHERYAIPLLVTALCEIHANSIMFGGLESTNFKIKFKAIERLGKRLLIALDMKSNDLANDTIR